MSTHLLILRRLLAGSACAIVLAGTAGCNPAPAPDGAAAGSTEPVCPAFLSASNGLPSRHEWRTHPSIADVNGDGLGDIAGVARKGQGSNVFLSDGLGNWTNASEGLFLEAGPSCGIGTRLIDLNRDGHLDVLLADHCQGVWVYHGNGGSSWKDSSLGIPRNLQGFNDADATDLDGDGIDDIVAISAYSRGFLVLKGTAKGNWTVRHDTGLPEVGSGHHLTLADVNADGRPDVVVAFSAVSRERRVEPPPPARVWLQNEDGSFRPAGGFPDEGRFLSVTIWPRAGHAVPDLIYGLTGAYGGIYRYRSETGEEWKNVERIDQPWFDDSPRSVVGLDRADFNGDGCDDLVATEGRERKILLFLSDCRGGWTMCDQAINHAFEMGGGWGVAAGDLNGDGRPDVVAGFVASDEGGGLRAWFQTDGGTPAARELPPEAQGQIPAESSVARGSGSGSPEP